MIRIRLSRWYLAAAVRLPGFPTACIGLGLSGYEAAARSEAASLAATL